MKSEIIAILRRNKPLEIYHKTIILFLIFISVLLLITNKSYTQEHSSYYNKVIDYCTQQLKKDTQNQYFYTARGIAKYQLQNYEEAINDLA